MPSMRHHFFRLICRYNMALVGAKETNSNRDCIKKKPLPPVPYQPHGSKVPVFAMVQYCTVAHSPAPPPQSSRTFSSLSFSNKIFTIKFIKSYIKLFFLIIFSDRSERPVTVNACFTTWAWFWENHSHASPTAQVHKTRLRPTILPQSQPPVDKVLSSSTSATSTLSPSTSCLKGKKKRYIGYWYR
ncbi:hypothetical protein C7212DRAFT_341493 [Tuber magnatum]|uniref:Uncharacterized protein n=1 Tax=Tuber magnatum TaxID=42249 RepID=A0A317T025_9PEZI|nr:hypothetical protein C7212DRAFT_341493 [Tuber magnatum]